MFGVYWFKILAAPVSVTVADTKHQPVSSRGIETSLDLCKWLYKQIVKDGWLFQKYANFVELFPMRDGTVELIVDLKF